MSKRITKKNKAWTQEEKDDLIESYQDDRVFFKSDRQWTIREANKRGVTVAALECLLYRMKADGMIKQGRIQESPYIQYDQPLEVEGDALVLCDLEAPFQHSNFVNHCLDLAAKRKIKNVILAGDAVHFDALSMHAPSWKVSDKDNGRLDQDTHDELWRLAQTMTGKARKALEDKIMQMGEKKEVDDPDKELSVARSVLHRLGDQFEAVYYALGNHEGRALAQAERQLSPDVLLDEFQLKSGKWHIAPYYHVILHSGGETWRITHPVPLADKAAADFAAMHQMNIICAHNHRYHKTIDISGRFLAFSPGCCVDESRLAYAAQRDRTTRAHFLGACMVVGGRLIEINQFAN